MSEKTCVICRIAIDETEQVCPYCGERQPEVRASYETSESPAATIPWNLIAGVVMAVAVAVIAGSGWASAGRAKSNAEKALLPPEEPTNEIMTAEEAKREQARIRRWLVDELSQWDRMADFGGVRMKTNGVLELTARVHEDDPGRRIGKFVASQVQSRVGGRFKVRGLVVNASNGHRLFFQPWHEPITSKRK